jgi:hypothetical protein
MFEVDRTRENSADLVWHLNSQVRIGQNSITFSDPSSQPNLSVCRRWKPKCFTACPQVAGQSEWPLGPEEIRNLPEVKVEAQISIRLGLGFN